MVARCAAAASGMFFLLGGLTSGCDQGTLSLGVGRGADLPLGGSGGSAPRMGGDSGLSGVGGVSSGAGGRIGSGGSTGGARSSDAGGTGGIAGSSGIAGTGGGATSGRTGRGTLTRLSYTYLGIPMSAFDASISDDGNRIAFTSDGLDPEDTNLYQDIYVHDRNTGNTVRVNVTPEREAANDSSDFPALSPDGSRLTFVSMATNLVPDVMEGSRQRLYITQPLNELDDMEPGVVSVTPLYADASTGWSALSARAETIVFYSEATNLVAGDPSGLGGVFLYRSGLETTERLNRIKGNVITPAYFGVTSIASDGSRAVFYRTLSGAAYVSDLDGSELKRVDFSPEGAPPDGDTSYAKLSTNGQRVVFVSTASNLVEGDTNGVSDVFVRDLNAGETWRVSVSSDGAQADGASDEPAISGDGRWVVYRSLASNLVSDRSAGEYAVFLYDLQTATTVEVELAESDPQSGPISQPSLSYDGRVLVFESIFFGAGGVFSFDFDE